MSRYDWLMEQLTKKVDFSKYKEGEVIADWSPNNIRRIAFGVEGVMIQYHVKAGRFKEILEFLKYPEGLVQSDYQLLSTNNAVKSVTEVLYGRRVLSCIEEIIFLTEGYNTQLMQYDYQGLSKAVSGKHNFPRLTKVYTLKTNILSLRALMQTASLARIKEELLFDVVTSEEIRKAGYPAPQVVFEGQQNYYSYTPLRGNFYAMDADGGALKTHLSKIATQKEQLEKQDIKDEVMYRDGRKALEASMRVLALNMRVYEDIMKEVAEIHAHLPLIYTVQWGYRAQRTHAEKEIAKKVKVYALYTNMRLVDVVALAKLLDAQEPVDAFYPMFLETFKKYCPDVVTKGTLSVKASLDVLEKFSSILAQEAVYKSYEVYSAFITDNTPEYALEYHKMLSPVLEPFKYDVKIIEHLNTTLNHYGHAKESFDNIGHVLVQVAEFDLKERYETALRIAKATQTYMWVEKPTTMKEWKAYAERVNSEPKG